MVWLSFRICRVWCMGGTVAGVCTGEATFDTVAGLVKAMSNANVARAEFQHIDLPRRALALGSPVEARLAGGLSAPSAARSLAAAA
jgi:hypothetical protein